MCVTLASSKSMSPGNNKSVIEKSIFYRRDDLLPLSNISQ